MTVNALGTPVALIVVTVAGEDITPPLAFNLPVTNGVATGTLEIPPGVNRILTAIAYESDGRISHQGSLTLPVVERGQNPLVSVPMVPSSGQQPISVTIGTVSVAVSPSTASLSVNQTLQLTAEIRAADGQVLAVSPQWATTDPTVLTVSPQGLVTAVREGQADIVATYAGVAGVSRIVAGAANSMVWESFFTSGVVPSQEQCDSWTNFRTSQSGAYSRITVSGSLDPFGVTCDDPALATQICNNLALQADFDVLCNGQHWYAYTWDGWELAINPTNLGGNNCPAPGYYVRPCIGNVNWGGANTATCNAPSQTMRVECAR